MTTIEWTQAPGFKGESWNPLWGCSHVTEGCRNCYAAMFAHRFSGPGQRYEGLTRMTPQGARWTGEVRLVPDALDKPLRWREPRMVFVNSMSDLFHEAVPFEFIAAVYGVIALTPRHIYQVLTKRPDRAVEFFRWLDREADSTPGEGLNWRRWRVIRRAALSYMGSALLPGIPGEDSPWPLPNVWLVASVENQEEADKRIPYLLQVPAAVRGLSMEPLLGAVNLNQWMPLTRYQAPRNSNYLCPQCGYVGDGEHWSVPTGEGDYNAICPNCGATEWDIDEVECGTIDWIIVGGESGPKARPMHPAWVRSIRDQCQAAGVPWFFKQWGEWLPGQNDPHPQQSWGVAHWQDGTWGGEGLPRNPERNYVVWWNDGVARFGSQEEHILAHSSRGIVAWAQRVGKHRAGALLDGRLWREWPEVAAKGATA